jgi:elongation factor Ts
VPAAIVATEREVAGAQSQGKPPAVIEKIITGRLDKYFSTVCLLEQVFVKDDKKTINDLLTAKISELGENIVIRRFTRFQVGENLPGQAVPAAE